METNGTAAFPTATLRNKSKVGPTTIYMYCDSSAFLTGHQTMYISMLLTSNVLM